MEQPSGGQVRTIGADHVALREQVLAELRRRIVDGDYAQGERLTETRLADDFGVSRNPVREALRVVEAEGFVQILPRRGAVVATLDDTAVRDLFAVREQLETLAAGLAAERATANDMAHLRRLLDQAELGDRCEGLRPGRRAEQRLPSRGDRGQRQPLAALDLRRDVPTCTGSSASVPPTAHRTRGRSTSAWSRRSKPATRRPRPQRRANTWKPPPRPR